MLSTILRRTTNNSSKTHHFLFSAQARKMSQQQQMRRGEQGQDNEPIKYGDVFPVEGDLADQAIAPQDAAMMQSAENTVTGQTQKGGPAAVMQSAAAVNERVGAVRHGQASSIPRGQGVTVTETRVPGGRIVTEFVAGQAVGQYMEADTAEGGGGVEVADPTTKITIGEALEATARIAGSQPVEQSDAAAIQAAEARATGLNVTLPGGVAAEAQSAANANVWVSRDENKTKLGDVLSNATAKLPADKPVERDDAARVVGAEMRNKPDATTRPGGVAASVAAAARLNRDTV